MGGLHDNNKRRWKPALVLNCRWTRWALTLHNATLSKPWSAWHPRCSKPPPRTSPRRCTQPPLQVNSLKALGLNIRRAKLKSASEHKFYVTDARTSEKVRPGRGVRLPPLSARKVAPLCCLHQHRVLDISFVGTLLQPPALLTLDTRYCCHGTIVLQVIKSAKLEEIRLTILNNLLQFHPESGEQLAWGTPAARAGERVHGSGSQGQAGV